MEYAILTQENIDQMISSGSTRIFQKAIESVEKPIIESVLIFCRGNQTEASKMLGLNRATLRKKMKYLGMRK